MGPEKFLAYKNFGSLMILGPKFFWGFVREFHDILKIMFEDLTVLRKKTIDQ